MQPEQSPGSGGNYDFIMNPSKPAKPKGHGLIGGNGYWFKIVLIVGGAVALMIVLAVIINIFFGTKTNVEDLVGITQTQQEVVRVSNLSSKAADQQLRNVAETAEQTVLSQQKSLLVFLQNKGQKLTEKQLGLKQSAANDKQLATAQASGTYDTVYRQILRADLQAYATQLKSAYDNASTKDKLERSILSSDYTQVQTLLKSLP